MPHSLDPLRFHFQEDLALKNSLHAIGQIVLEYALKSSGANSGVFLYAAPGATLLEKVATLGLSKNEDADWSRCDRGSKLPLPEAIRSQKYVELSEDEAVTLMAFPLHDADIASAGFSISFSTGAFISREVKDFLSWLAIRAEAAIFNKDGEGV